MRYSSGGDVLVDSIEFTLLRALFLLNQFVLFFNFAVPFQVSTYDGIPFAIVILPHVDHQGSSNSAHDHETQVYPNCSPTSRLCNNCPAVTQNIQF